MGSSESRQPEDLPPPPPGVLEYDPSEEEHRPKNSRQNAVLAHVGGFFGSFLVPLILWMVWRDKDDFAARHAREAMNYQISLYIHAVLLYIPAAGFFVLLWQAFSMNWGKALLFSAVLLIVMAIVLVIVEVLVIVLAAIAASKGRDYRYPLTLRFF